MTIIIAGVGIIFSEDPEVEVTSIDESFPEVDQDKFVGINVRYSGQKKREVIEIATIDRFKEALSHVRENQSITVDYSYNDTSSWYEQYEEVAIEIVKYLFPGSEVQYSMDLVRRIEVELQKEKETQCIS